MSVNPGRMRITMILACCLTCLILITGCAEKPSSTDETAIQVVEEEAQPYLGLDFPSSTVSRFAPNHFSKMKCMPPDLYSRWERDLLEYDGVTPGCAVYEDRKTATGQDRNRPFDLGGRAILLL